MESVLTEMTVVDRNEQHLVQVKKLHDRIDKLKAENIRYRETNRTAEFEAAAAALQRQVWCRTPSPCLEVERTALPSDKHRSCSARWALSLLWTLLTIEAEMMAFTLL